MSSDLPAFPDAGIMPKGPTQATAFLEAHPEYDGRGIVVAILDTGVDPGAAGLAVTSDGKPKILDIVEASGSGDTDTSVVVKAEEDGTLKGLSGRTLRLNPAWSNPSGDWHLGLKPGFEFFPPGLKRRWTSVNSAETGKVFGTALAAARARVDEFKAKNPSPKGDAAAQLKDLENRVSTLSAIASSENLGPVYDCVVFHDGKAWRAALDSSETGDLTAAPALTNFRAERQYATLSSGTSLNYCLNIYDDGNVLSVVCDAGSHGTHVASITAGNHPDAPELNGVAPGAQIVAVKIGDTRLGSMETGSGLIRGLKAVVDNDCHLINLSYGESATIPDIGRFVEMADRVVRRHNVIFLSSAGNNGPALTTVGAPGGTTSSVIGIGAMVAPDMMRAQYSMRTTVPPINYTWSSRGPTVDGSLAVSVSAPGGAIASVPNWTLQKSQLMNGTSMSCPNACGNVALLLSALAAQGRAWTPYAIRRAIQNTAAPVEGSDVFGLGHGLLSVNDAYASLESADTECHGYSVRVPYMGAGAGTDKDRGIYIRDLAGASTAREAMVIVKPLFELPIDDTAGGNTDADQSKKIAFEQKVALVSTAPEWVRVPDHVLLMHGGRNFNVFVDPRVLPEGSGAHYGEIQGFDVANPGNGPLFRVPVTVIKPVTVPLSAAGANVEMGTPEAPLALRPGTIHRKFIAVPKGATWVDIVVNRVDGGDGTAAAAAGRGDSDGDGDDEEEAGHGDGARAGAGAAGNESRRLIVVHGVQVVPNKALRETECERYLRPTPGSVNCVSMAVTDKHTLEMAIAQFWSSLGDTELAVEVQFKGVDVVPSVIGLHSADGFAEVSATPRLHSVPFSPSASLTTWRRVLRPKQAAITVLSERNTLVNLKRQYALTLTYSFDMTAAGSIKPVADKVHKVLYESPYDAQFVIISNENKRAVGASDAYPESVKLGKGSYEARLQVRSDNMSSLESLTAMPMCIEQSISKITLSVSSSRVGVLTGGSSLPKRRYLADVPVPAYVAPPPDSKLPKGIMPGDVLLGTLKLASYGEGTPGTDTHPNGTPIRFHAGPKSKKASSGGASDGRTPEETFQEEQLTATLKSLASLKGDTFDATYALVAARFPDDPRVPQAALHAKDKAWTKADPEAVIKAADAVCAAVDAGAVSAYFAERRDLTDAPAEAKKTHSAMETARSVLIDALFRKARAFVKSLGLRSSSSSDEEGAEESKGSDGAGAGAGAEDGFEAALAELKKWTDVAQDQYNVLSLEQHVRKGHVGSALSLAWKAWSGGKKACGSIGDSKTAYDLVIRLAGVAGETVFENYLKAQRSLHFPPNLQPF